MNVVLKLGHVQTLVDRSTTHALKVETDRQRQREDRFFVQSIFEFK